MRFTPRNARLALACWLLPVIAGCAGSERPGDVELFGVADKGPLPAGSAVRIEVLDGGGAIERTLTDTTDGSGAFSVSGVPANRWVRVVASGFAYDESLGMPNIGSLTLRAYFRTGTSPRERVNLNLFSLLEAARTDALVDGGSSLDEATVQAARELRTSLGTMVASDVELGTPSTSLALDGPTDADAMLVAMSTWLTSGGTPRSLADRRAALWLVDPQYPDLTDDLALAEAAFGSSGTFGSTWPLGDYARMGTTPYAEILPELENFLSSIGRGPTVRDPRTVLDPDHDGLTHDRDLCPMVADPAQLDADGDGIGDACDPCVDTDCGPTRDACIPAVASGPGHGDYCYDSYDDGSCASPTYYRSPYASEPLEICSSGTSFYLTDPVPCPQGETAVFVYEYDLYDGTPLFWLECVPLPSGGPIADGDPCDGVGAPCVDGSYCRLGYCSPRCDPTTDTPQCASGLQCDEDGWFCHVSETCPDEGLPIRTYHASEVHFVGEGRNLDLLDNAPSAEGPSIAGCGVPDHAPDGIDNALESVTARLAPDIDFDASFAASLMGGSHQLGLELGNFQGASDSCFDAALRIDGTRLPVGSQGTIDYDTWGAYGIRGFVATQLWVPLPIELAASLCGPGGCTTCSGASCAPRLLLHDPYIRVLPSADGLGATVYLAGAVFVSDSDPAYAGMPTLASTLADWASASNVLPEFASSVNAAFDAERDLHLDSSGRITPCTGAALDATDRNAISIGMRIDFVID